MRVRSFLLRLACIGLATWVLTATIVSGQDPLPELTGPVNDFAHVIDGGNAADLERMIRTLLKATGDTVVVVTVPSIQPYGSIQEYAVELFENRGRGIGQKGKDNGVLVVLAVAQRSVWIEVGYDLEQFITDGFAGETSRQYMVPFFRQGDYGGGLGAGVRRVVSRIAEGRGVTLPDLPAAIQPPEPAVPRIPISTLLFLLIVLLAIASNWTSSNRRRRRRWGGGPWSGWNSGVGSFGGGGFGGGFGGFGGGGGGGGGGFGGFGGGRSGGGGGGASW